MDCSNERRKDARERNLQVTLFSSSRPRVGFRFLLTRSAVSLTSRSFCKGGVMKQGRAPDMIEGEVVTSLLCL